MSNLLKALWDQVKKTPDGNGVMFTDKDIEFLWHCGFVDTTQVPFPQWSAFFVPFLNKEAGVYVLSKANFFLIDDFRYKGLIRFPFDYTKINEGKYTDQGLDELFEQGIKPSIEIAQQEFSDFLTGFKTEFRMPDKLIRIDKANKEKIGAWMNAHPSPLRRLELIMEAKSTGKPMDPKLFRFEVGSDPVANMQATVFSMRPGSVAVSKKEALGKLTQTKPQKTGSDAANTTPLHKLKRSPKGTRS